MLDNLKRLAALALAVAASGANAVPTGNIAYTWPNFSNSEAWLVDWGSGGARATVVGLGGVRGGAVSRSGAQNVITLDTPYSVTILGTDFDPCLGDLPEVRQDTLQIAVTPASGTDNRGTVAWVTLGTLTTLNGCTPGTVTTFGSLTDPGTTLRNLALSLRPAVTDLVPGAALAGPSEEARLPDDPFVSGDVLTLQAGGLGVFSASGSTVPAAFNASQWLVLGLPSGQRAYTRLSVDRRTGAEQWLDADWSGSAPTSVRSLLMVKPAAGAGFGTARRASRIWQSGLFVGSPTDFSIWLYTDLTGERVIVDTVAGTESRSPVTWSLAGANLVQQRSLGGGTGTRTWKPLANTNAGRSHFVMEDERFTDPSGATRPLIKPRVNFYNDLGPATRP